MIDILIPVLNRPHRAEPLVQNIAHTTKAKHHILFICSKGDVAEIDACRATGEDVMVVPWEAGPADFAKKINIGFRSCEGEYAQVGADDLRFHRGWDREALRVAKRYTASVIGTNDLHNPRVKRGSHSTHPFIPREYVNYWDSGTFDDTGTIFCELYDHQYVDDELVQTAILRRAWVYAQDALVEHLHPYFGGSEMDPTYEKAVRRAREDHRLYTQRLRLMRKRIPRDRRERTKRR